MDRRLRLSVILVIIAAVLVASCLAAERKSARKQKNKDRKQKGDRDKGGGGGQSSKEDRAVKQVLRNMAKVSSPLRLPPSPPNNNNKKKNDDDNDPRSSAVAVSVDFGITAVSDVNVNGGYVDLEGTLTTVWQDPRLKFDLSKVSKEIRTLRVDPATIWTPDLEVYNAVAPGLQRVTGKPLAVVSHSGDVFYSTQVSLRSACDVMGQLSDSEVVNCTVKMGSWTYNGFELQLNMNQANMNILHGFAETGLWAVTAAKAWVGEELYACCPETYPYTRFSYLLRKRVLPSH